MGLGDVRLDFGVVDLSFTDDIGYALLDVLAQVVEPEP